MKIIGAAVDHHGPPDDIPHPETICQHSKEGPSVTAQQRRQVPCVVRVGTVSGIIVPAGIRKVLAGAGPALVDMKGEKARFIFPGQTAPPGNKQNPSFDKIQLCR